MARYTAGDLVLQTSLMTWQDARAGCIAIGAGWDLVSIANSAENDIIKAVATTSPNGNTWIGLNDFTVEHQWDWPDSCSSNPFTGWAPGEPNNLGNEDCVEFYANGQWNDYSCAALRQSICGNEPASCPTNSPTNAPTPPTPTNAPTVSPEPWCDCVEVPDLLTCPLADAIFSNGPTSSEYILTNFLALGYKVLFVLSLRFLFGCHAIDLGKRPFLCFDFIPLTYLILFFANIILATCVYFTRCIPWLWCTFFVMFLHVDAVACMADRYMNRKLKAPEKPAPPRSNLELFAYTNNKKGWKEKAYQTVELKGAKKVIAKTGKDLKRAEKAEVERKESLRKKGFSFKGIGMI
jgi:hypothetical protein